MKRIIATFALAFVTLAAFGQNFPAGMRNDICEVEQDDHTYSIFSFKDEDGVLGYYLSLGRVFNLLEISRDDMTDFSLDHVDETFLWMGTTSDDALKFLESLLEFIDEDTGTSKQFPCRWIGGINKLSDFNIATCVVTKRFLQSKRLCFYFSNGYRSAEADLTRSAIKSLRWSYKLNQQLHPED